MRNENCFKQVDLAFLSLYPSKSVRLLKKFVVNVDKTHDCVFFLNSINEHSFDTCLDHSSFTGYHLRPLKMVENHSDEGNNNKQVHRKFLGKRSI